MNLAAWYEIPGRLGEDDKWIERIVLCFRHAVQAAMTNEDVEQRLGDPPMESAYGRRYEKPCGRC